MKHKIKKPHPTISIILNSDEARNLYMALEAKKYALKDRFEEKGVTKLKQILEKFIDSVPRI